MVLLCGGDAFAWFQQHRTVEDFIGSVSHNNKSLLAATFRGTVQSYDILWWSSCYLVLSVAQDLISAATNKPAPPMDFTYVSYPQPAVHQHVRHRKLFWSTTMMRALVQLSYCKHTLIFPIHAVISVLLQLLGARPRPAL